MYKRRFGRRRFGRKRTSRRKISRRSTYKRNQGVKTTSAVLRYSGSFLASSVAGVIQQQVPLWDPSACADWSNYTQLYDQFRVNAVKILCVPCQPFNPSMPGATAPCLYTPLYEVIDRNDTGPLTSVVQSLNYDTCRIHATYGKVGRFIKTNLTASERTWRATGAPSTGPMATGAWKCYASSLSTTTNYYVYFAVYYIQFRGGV